MESVYQKTSGFYVKHSGRTALTALINHHAKYRYGYTGRRNSETTGEIGEQTSCSGRILQYYVSLIM
jgi:hypothetical protein